MKKLKPILLGCTMLKATFGTSLIDQGPLEENWWRFECRIPAQEFKYELQSPILLKRTHYSLLFYRADKDFRIKIELDPLVFKYKNVFRQFVGRFNGFLKWGENYGDH